MFGEIIYQNHNKDIKKMPVENHEDFSIFVKANIHDIGWARYYFNNFMIDEYNNLSNFKFTHLEMHFPARLAHNEYTIVSKWNIEKFKDFIGSNFPEESSSFFVNPDSFNLSDINVSLVDNEGNIVATTMPESNQKKPIIPKDIIVVKTEYLQREFNKISELSLSENQKQDLFDIDQFTMLNIGI